MIMYFLAQQHMFNSCHSVSKASISRDRKAYDSEVVGQPIVPLKSSEWDNFPDDWYLQQEASSRASGVYDAHKFIKDIEKPTKEELLEATVYNIKRFKEVLQRLADR